MRKLGLSLFLAFGATSSLVAQAMPWKPEVGVRLNYTKTTIDGTDITTIGVPAGNGYASLGGVAGLYGVIPVNDRWAVEPSIGFLDAGFAGTAVTQGNFTARVLFSAYGPIYVAAGPTLAFARISGTQSSVWGGQAAVGYRRHLSGSLQGRAEVYYEKQGESSLVGNEKPHSWGVTIGLGLTPHTMAGRRMTSTGLWSPMIGLQAGYSHLSVKSGGDITTLSVPGLSNTALIAGSTAPITGIAPIFVVIPVGQRIAIEPNLTFSKYEIDGGPKASALGVGVHGNYAFNKALYAGLSYDVTSYGGDLDVDATTGFGVQGGVRFPLVAGFQGRTELSFRKMSGDDSFIGDHTVTGLAFAVMAPLK